MRWYDVFSWYYDLALEAQYREGRAAALSALELSPGMTVLDIPCGTGQSFDTLAPAVLPGGSVIGVDVSDGMLGRARRRAFRHGWDHVHAVVGDVTVLTTDDLVAAVGQPVRVHRVLTFLGLSVFPDWEASFHRLWGMLEPGGRFVIVDVHDPRPGLQGRMVNTFAQADISRRVWEPLEAVSVDYFRIDLPRRWEHGGQIFLAAGSKPA